MNKSIIKELVRESIRTSVGSKQTNESLAIAAGIWAGSVIFGSALLGASIGSVLRDMKNRRIAVEAYQRYGNLVDGKFIKSVFKGLGVSDEDLQILLLASNLQVDPTSYPSKSDDFDTDRKFVMVSSRVKPVLDSLTNRKIPQIFTEGDNSISKFGDAENANLTAVGLVIDIVANVQQFVKGNRTVGITFDNEDQKEFKNLLKAVKQRYRI